MEEYEISVRSLKTGMGSQGIVKPTPRSDRPQKPDDSAPLVAWASGKAFERRA
jgi:hypothetical protein